MVMWLEKLLEGLKKKCRSFVAGLLGMTAVEDRSNGLERNPRSLTLPALIEGTGISLGVVTWQGR